VGKKAPVDSRDALAGDEKEDEKHGKDRRKGEENNNSFNDLIP
jgi:hypothetical protein